MKEYLLEINERNALDTVFYRLISLPWLLVTLKVMSDCTATIPKAIKSSRTTYSLIAYPSTFQSSSDLHRCSLVNIIPKCL
jgi:hypothetical protein